MTRTEGNKDPAVSDLQALCRQIGENSSLPMATVTGPEHVICYVNPAFCALVGKRSEELICVPFSRVVPEGNVCLLLLERLYRTGESQSHTDEEDPKGQPRWSYSMWAVPHAFPRPAGILIQVVDANRASQTSQHAADVNKELMITAVRQHELLEAADRLSKELEKEIIERKRIETALKDSLVDKEVLLRELSHRTKNNLQVIISLLGMQASKSKDARMAEALSDAQDRVRTMALVYEKLHRSGSVSSVNVKAYVEELVTTFLRAHRGVGGKVQSTLELEEMEISHDQALPVGLILNELLSNSVKHAFLDGKAGNIIISLKRLGEKMELRYRDDGQGLPAGMDLSRGSSLGLKLVYNLAARQLLGTVELVSGPGAEIIFRFPAR